MKYSTVIDRLQNLINITPSVGDLATVTGLTAKNLYARRDFDREFSEEELSLIEAHYGVSLLGGNDPDKVTLDYYPDVHASAGFGELILEEHAEKIAVTKDVIKNYSKSNKYSVIDCKGDSMEPRLLDGDKLIVKHNVENIVDNNVYVFRYDGDLYVKRLARNLDEIIVMSENKRFGDKVVKKGTVTLLGEIVGLIRSKV